MRLLRVFLPLLLLLIVSSQRLAGAQQASDALNAAARELAAKVASLMDRSSKEPVEIMADSRNLSSLPAVMFREGLKAFEQAIEERGVRVSGAARVNGPAVRLFLTENSRDYLWIAQVSGSGAGQVAIASVARTGVSSPATEAGKMTLSSQFLVSDREPILDILSYKLPAVPDSSGAASPQTDQQRLLVLEPGQIRIFRPDPGGWIVDATLPFDQPSVLPRDVRGRLVNSSGSLTAVFPNSLCHISYNTLWAVSCDLVPTPAFFPVFSSPEFTQTAQFESQRNFFRSAGEVPGVRPGNEPFFSVAYVWIQGSASYAVASHLDGRVRLYAPPDEPIDVLTGWGDGVISLETNCGQKWQLLATHSGDWTEPDSIQAYEIVDRQPVAVSSAVDFPGPVTALWEGDTPAQAHAVVRNLSSGMYEAYVLSLTCGQ
jgi:hypothetical protein